MRVRILRHAKELITKFRRDCRGTMALTVAIGIVPLVAVVGISADAARSYIVKARLSQAADAAGLAAAKVIFSESAMQADAVRFRDANFPPQYLGSNLVDWQVARLGADNSTIEVTATAQIPTSFMQVVGVESVDISVRSVIERSSHGMEVALVMDNTGSMRSSSKMSNMKVAAADLVDQLYGQNETISNLWVGLVPYTATVNVGSEHTDWLSGYDASAFGPTNWKGCVEARGNGLDETDEPPSTAGFVPHLWQTTIDDYDEWRSGGSMGTSYKGDNDWNMASAESIDETNIAKNDGTGPNLGCGPAITPLIQSKQAAIDAIDEMQPWHRGGTMGNLGLVWGWRLLSPRWQGLWGNGAMPLDYGIDNMNKVIIILTDGHNQWYDWPGGLPGKPAGSSVPGADYTAYGRLNEERLGNGIDTNSEARAELNERMLRTCTAIKNNGIILYTITFALSDGTTKDMYRQCATNEQHHFDADDGVELSFAFGQIGNELTNLRLAE